MHTKRYKISEYPRHSLQLTTDEIRHLDTYVSFGKNYIKKQGKFKTKKGNGRKYPKKSPGKISWNTSKFMVQLRLRKKCRRKHRHGFESLINPGSTTSRKVEKMPRRIDLCIPPINAKKTKYHATQIYLVSLGWSILFY